jgi:heat shock protein HtpX
MYHQIARNKRNSIIVVSLFLIVWILAGFVIGLFGGSTSDAIIGAVILGLLGVGAALFSYYYGASTVLSAAGAREADPRLYQQLYNIVQTLAIGDGLPVPKVYIIDDPSPNAFATGRDPQHAAVTVTTGLLQMMDREELMGVLAHEMSHVKNFDVRLLLVVTTMIGLAAIISSVIWNGALRFRSRDARAVLIVVAIGIVFTLIAFILGPIMQMALSRQRESLADVSGVDQRAQEDRRQRPAHGEVQPRDRGHVHRQSEGAPWQLLQPPVRHPSADRGAHRRPGEDRERPANLISPPRHAGRSAPPEGRRRVGELHLTP